MNIPFHKGNAELCLNEAGKKQPDLARHFKITTQAVNQWFEKGVIPISRAMPMGKFLGCHPSKFCDYPIEKNQTIEEPVMENSKQEALAPLSDMKKIYLTSTDLAMLDALKKVPEKMKIKAVSVIEDFAEMPEEKQKQMVDCAMRGEVCESSKHHDHPTEGEAPLRKAG